MNLSPPGRMAAGDQWREQRPFGVIEIAGVGTDIHGGAPGSSNSPHPQQWPAPNLWWIKHLHRAIKLLNSLLPCVWEQFLFRPRVGGSELPTGHSRHQERGGQAKSE